jgi:hypothetical protein
MSLQWVHPLENKSILECLQFHLSMEQFSNVTCCTKKGYTLFNTGCLKWIRLAYKKYYHPIHNQATKKWICFLIKNNSGKALQWLLDLTLREYFKCPDAKTNRYTEYAVAVSDFARCGYEESLKHNNVALYKQLRAWYTHLLSLNDRNLSHNFLYCDSLLDPEGVVLQAIHTAILKGYGKTAIALFKEEPELFHANDESFFYMFTGSAIAGDVEGYHFWKALSNLPRGDWGEGLFQDILEYGTSPNCLALVKKSMLYPDTDAGFGTMYRSAFRNKRLQMLEYVVSIDEDVSSRKEEFVQDYLEKEDALHKLLFKLIRDPHDKHILRAMRRIQKRLDFLQRVLLHECDTLVNDFRGRSHTDWNVDWNFKKAKRDRI